MDQYFGLAAPMRDLQCRRAICSAILLSFHSVVAAVLVVEREQQLVLKAEQDSRLCLEIPGPWVSSLLSLTAMRGFGVALCVVHGIMESEYTLGITLD